MSDQQDAGPGHPFAEFQAEGLLWLVNRVVFHPRGYALAFHVDDDMNVIGWSLQGDGTETWDFRLPPTTEDELFNRVKAILP